MAKSVDVVMDVLFKISSFQAHASTYSYHHLSSENRRIRCLVIAVEVVEAIEAVEAVD
jgi:hypothetical protein